MRSSVSVSIFAVASSRIIILGLCAITLAKEINDENTILKPTFRVTVKRADKRIPMKSYEIAGELAGVILATVRFKVSLEKHDYEFMVDMRENGYSFVYSKVIMGAGGLPVGCSGKGMMLLSGGIDSPVAGYMMAKRGMKLFAVHFASPPYTSDKAKEKVVELKEIMERYAGKIKLYVVPFTDIQMEIHKSCPSEFMITIMRRYMMRIATILAEKEDCKSIVTGESLGQVASQTVESMTCTGSTTYMPIFRPLIGFDKEDIMTLAKKIGTFETSILPYEDCCTVFLPKSPAIKPRLSVVEKAEEAMKEVGEELVKKAIENVEII
ncbi:MAG: tRNA 4-thiouridine(8) synthase ThiI [Clostridia bacterium]|nr:tRNA 4-thiouridine(8) synthase ThiI [Clostridia bacterium]